MNSSADLTIFKKPPPVAEGSLDRLTDALNRDEPFAVHFENDGVDKITLDVHQAVALWKWIRRREAMSELRRKAGPTRARSN